MSSCFCGLKVIVEPLVDRFVAWPHTVAPVQASMNLAFLHVPLLESYLQNPQVHVAASSNPALRGGYFVNIAEERSDEVARPARRDQAGPGRHARVRRRRSPRPRRWCGRTRPAST